MKKELKIHIKETRGLYQATRLEGKVKRAGIKPMRKTKQKKV